MSELKILQILKYIFAIAICYFSFVVLQRHYTENMTWKDAMKAGGKHIGVGLLFILGSPVGIFILGIAAVFIILTLGDIL